MSARLEALPNDRAATERASRDAQRDELLVAFSDCESAPLGKQAFLKVLALELGRQRLREAAPEVAAVSLSYRCDGTAYVRLTLTSPALERRLRVDDVAPRERARALALAVAELARGGEPASSSLESSPEPDPAPAANPAAKPVSEEPPAKAKPPAARASAARRDAAQASKAQPEPAESGAIAEPEPAVEPASARALVAGGARMSLQVSAYCYGGAFGLDYRNFRLLIEGCGATSKVARGTITSGIAAVRVGRAQPVVRLGVVQLGVDISAAGGVNWAVGDSSVASTHVRRVLMPYADARVGLFATSRARVPFTPVVELYAGRAVGIVASADGKAVSATGGWFSGVELGLWL